MAWQLPALKLDPAPLQWPAPYSDCAIGEDALDIFDAAAADCVPASKAAVPRSCLQALNRHMKAVSGYSMAAIGVGH